MGDPGETGKAEGINQPEPPSEQQEEGRDPRVREDSTAGTEQTQAPQPDRNRPPKV
jgi:hypothetical protein